MFTLILFTCLISNQCAHIDPTLFAESMQLGTWRKSIYMKCVILHLSTRIGRGLNQLKKRKRRSNLLGWGISIFMAQPAVMQCTRGNKKMEALQPCQTIRPNQANMKTIGGRLVFFLLLRFSLLLFPVLMKCLYGTRLYSRSAVHQQPEPKRRDVRWARIQEQQQQQPQQTAQAFIKQKTAFLFSLVFLSLHSQLGFEKCNPFHRITSRPIYKKGTSFMKLEKNETRRVPARDCILYIRIGANPIKFLKGLMFIGTERFTVYLRSIYALVCIRYRIFIIISFFDDQM